MLYLSLTSVAWYRHSCRYVCIREIESLRALKFVFMLNNMFIAAIMWSLLRKKLRRISLKWNSLIRILSSAFLLSERKRNLCRHCSTGFIKMQNVHMQFLVIEVHTDQLVCCKIAATRRKIGSRVRIWNLRGLGLSPYVLPPPQSTFLLEYVATVRLTILRSKTPQTRSDDPHRRGSVRRKSLAAKIAMTRQTFTQRPRVCEASSFES